MIKRLIALIVALWLLGFALFVVTLPRPAPDNVVTDAVIVLTGARERIPHGLELLQQKKARIMLISGVAPAVRPKELAAEYKFDPALFDCCIELGKVATDTKSNAQESIAWIREHKVKSVRLVTSDWHMPRASYDLNAFVDPGTTLILDAVPTNSGLSRLFREYNKYLLRRISGLFGY